MKGKVVRSKPVSRSITQFLIRPLAGSLHKLQLMLDICNTEMKFLDLKFNVAKSHVLRFGKIMLITVVAFQ